MSTRIRPGSRRPSLKSSRVNTASTPNLHLSYARAVPRKSSLSVINAVSLATISDDSYDFAAQIGSMAPFTPSRGDGGDLDVGETVDVPGNMHGTVRFIGSVQGKRGKFAGVELSEEFASKGKNSGDVDGIHYFSTSVPGAGIFLPISRALRRVSPVTPSTPSLSGYKLSSQATGVYTPPTPSVPKFSQSVGPRAPSPGLKKTRPSLPRPESPLRRPGVAPRPSLGSLATPTAKGPGRYNSPAPAKFGQSVRGTQDSRDPSKKPGFTPRHAVKSSVGTRSASALGGTLVGYSDDELTPVGVTSTATNGSIGSTSSFNAKIRPASRAHNDDEIDRLRNQLDERDKQLREQASSLAEMESSLVEVQSLMGKPENSVNGRAVLDDKDAPQLRTLLRERNEKIAMLTAEFDAHRADFRSTIDTLELASTETERVYEKRVEDLLQEVRDLQDRSEDVESVARQLKQLEELVQELEEGLEDARRGEAEARGEVEFLRGEVERTRSELRREREKASAVMNGNGHSTNGDSGLAEKVESRDDEIRGLKAIIHSLSRDAVPDAGSPKSDHQKTPTHFHASRSKNRQLSESMPSIDEVGNREKLEREVQDLKAAIESRSSREEELEREIERLRRGSGGQPVNQRASGLSITTLAQNRSSEGTIVSWREKELQRSPESTRRKNTLETMPENDNYSSANESFCELCETSGHDILTCTNMFPKQNGVPEGQPPPIPQRSGRDIVERGLKNYSPKVSQDNYKPPPLSPLRKPNQPAPHVRIIPNPMESGPVAGKESGEVNMNKWCGVCEREGHDSIDCPFEDAF